MGSLGEVSVEWRTTDGTAKSPPDYAVSNPDSYYYTPANCVPQTVFVVGYTVFKLSVRLHVSFCTVDGEGGGVCVGGGWGCGGSWI